MITDYFGSSACTEPSSPSLNCPWEEWPELWALARERVAQDPDTRSKRKTGDGSARKLKRKKSDTDKTSKPQPGDMCPWWKPELNDLYAQVPSSNSDAAQLGFQLVQGRGRHEAKSWFSVKSIPLASAVDGPVAVSSSQSKHVNWRVLMDVHPDDVWSEETGAAFKDATASKGTKPESQPIKQVGCRKTCMRLTREQKRLLRKWMGAYRLTYNRAVELIRANPTWRGASCQYLNEQLVYASKNGHSSRVNENSTEEERSESTAKSAKMDEKRVSLGVQVGLLVRQHPWLQEIPTCIRKEACRDAAKAYASNEAKAKIAAARGKTHRWTLKYKNRRDDSAWTVRIPQQAIVEAWTLPRPETRRARNDDQPHKEQTRRFKSNLEKEGAGVLTPR